MKPLTARGSVPNRLALATAALATVALAGPAGAAIVHPAAAPKQPRLPSQCTAAATAPGWTCSFNVAPGTYQLRLTFGSKRQATDTVVRVEARRTVLPEIKTAVGQIVTRDVTVNVRTPESMPDGQEGNGTPGLQVYVSGANPALDGIKVLPRPHSRQIFVISDSTAADWLGGPKRGWAQELPQYLPPNVSLANYGDSGSSTVSWLSNPSLFAAVKPLIRPGDDVLIQLAHNDKTTTEAVYRANLRTLIDAVRSRGGKPVLVTPPVRHLFDATGKITPTGRIVNNLGVDLPAVMRGVAAESSVPLIDLTADSEALLEQLGDSASWPLYLTVAHDGVKDSTHFSEHGATVMAGIVFHELKVSSVS
ncbi:MAG TPA: rhamnogalacturonan acetylesterase [Actinocrinis sp.]|nr:rhamnogalacturonan acetylesterase [Actinocrinis sp.]